MMTMQKTIEINGRRIGPSLPAYVIAEMSANHGRDFDRAVEIVRAAKAAGADAVKLQTFTPSGHTLDSDREFFRVGGGTLWDGRTLHDLYTEAAMPWDWQPRLLEVATSIGIDLFSAPVDADSVDFLQEMGVPAYKIASFDMVDPHLIRRAAETGKPLVISTGMASLAEIEEAITAAGSGGATQVALLKCTSAYPAPVEEMNLRGIPHLENVFGVPVGLSDHSHGIVASVAAVALGACIIEKHFTLSRDLPGPDSGFSMEPAEFAEMVRAIRTVETALGSARYELGEQERAGRMFRRSLFVVRDVRAGGLLTPDNVRSIRPEHGLHPRHLPDVIGRRASRDIAAGTPMSWLLISEGGDAS